MIMIIIIPGFHTEFIWVGRRKLNIAGDLGGTISQMLKGICIIKHIFVTILINNTLSQCKRVYFGSR